LDKDYQKPEIDSTGIAVPAPVSVALGEIAADLREACSRSRACRFRL
jgi:hypothetical protein